MQLKVNGASGPMILQAQLREQQYYMAPQYLHGQIAFDLRLIGPHMANPLLY
jgi:hypothetical protein